MLRKIIAVLFFLLLSYSNQKIIPSDSCDWIGSGSGHRYVKVIHLRCQQGYVKWKNPVGALRLVFRNPPNFPNFRQCLSINSNSSGIVYSEFHSSLRVIYSPRDGIHPDRWRCLDSRNSQTVIIIERLSPGNFLEFRYDLRPLTLNRLECQQCTDKELLNGYCTSDFVIGGTLTNSRKNDAVQRTELQITIIKLYKSVDGDRSKDYSLLYQTYKCHTQENGEYIFMGRIILGTPFVSCTKHLSEWIKIAEKASITSEFPCKLD